MPSLNSKRQVRYTAADLNALAGAITLLEFMAEFIDDNQTSQLAKKSESDLRRLTEYVKQQRGESALATKPKEPTQPKIAG